MVTQWAPGSCCKPVSACASRDLAAALTAKALPDQWHGLAPENAGHLTAAFESGRSDSQRAPRVEPVLTTAGDGAITEASPAVGRGAAEP